MRIHHHERTPRTRRRSERGAGLVEYALLVSLIALVAFSAVSYFGSANAGGFGRSKSCIEAAYNDTLGTSCPAP